MELTTGIAIIAVILTLLGLMAASWRYVESRVDDVRSNADEKIDALRKESSVLVDKVAAIQDKARAELATVVASNTSRLERDVEVLKRETVRKEELSAIEVRLTAAVTKLETKLDTVLDRVAELRVEGFGKRQPERGI